MALLMVLKGLWRHPDFLKLWAGQTISIFGPSVTTLVRRLCDYPALAEEPEAALALGE